MTQSLDTNILIYALDQDTPGHEQALPLYRALLQSREDWFLADQVLFELYRALRNPTVFPHPLNGAKALEQIQFFRNKTRARHGAYESKLWPQVMRLLQDQEHRSGRLVFDAVLAVTLKAHGVKRFHTCNVKDFEAFGLFEVQSPFG